MEPAIHDRESCHSARLSAITMPLTKPNQASAIFALFFTALLAGCTTQLTAEGSKVGLVTAPQASDCNIMSLPLKVHLLTTP